MTGINKDFNSYYELICNYMHSFHIVSIDSEGYILIDYIAEGITKNEAIDREVNAYNSIVEKNGEALFCAFQIIQSKYNQAGTVNPNDTQQSPE